MSDSFLFAAALRAHPAALEPKIEYSGGRSPAVGLEAVRAALLEIGVGFERMQIRPGVEDILKASASRALTPDEYSRALRFFDLSRSDMLAHVAASNREPSMPNLGSMVTCEEGVPPYPKIYDMASMDAAAHVAAERKFGNLHVNRVQPDGPGVDEVMQAVSGGPWTWFYLHPTNGVMKFSFPAVPAGSATGWRLCYPGLIPHGAFMDPPHGLIIATLTGPEVWHMNYAGVADNPWIDFAGEAPVLLAKPKA